MTIIFEAGDFWIESFITSVSLSDAAGSDNSANNPLTRPARFLGGTVMAVSSTASNDNLEAVGLVRLLDQSFGGISFGEAITGVRVQTTKQIGTAGAVVETFNVIVFCRRQTNKV